MSAQTWTRNTESLGTQVRCPPDFETNTNTFCSLQFRKKHKAKTEDTMMLHFHFKKNNISQAKWFWTDGDVSCSRTLQQNKDQRAFYVNLLGPTSGCNCAAGRQRTGSVPVVESGERFDVPLAQSALLSSHVLVHSVGWNTARSDGLAATSFAQTTCLHHHAFPLPVGVSCS